MVKHLPKRLPRGQKDLMFFGTVPVKVLKDINPGLELKQILKYVENNLISKKFFDPLLDIVYVGQFNEIDNHPAHRFAFYSDNAIYLANMLKNNPAQIQNQAIAKDLVHEIGFIVEEKFGESFVYDNKDLEDEFLQKRSNLTSLLETKGGVMIPKELKKELSGSTEHSDSVYDFLYKLVGHEKLAFLSDELFLRPFSFSVMSLSEYFATGFVEYLLGEKDEVKRICSGLFKKLDNLVSHVLSL